MNRNDEYNELLAELESTPPGLEYTVSRANARAKKTKRNWKIFTVPASGLISLFAMFVLLINVSTPFAMACSRVPILRELTAAVALSPSLRAAVENDYVQLIGQEQTANGITMRIEYLIVDQKQLNVFYSLQSDTYSRMDVTPSIKGSDGSALESYAIWAGSYFRDSGELGCITIDFVGEGYEMPDSLILECRIQGRESDTQFTEAPAPVQDIWDYEPEEYTEPEFAATIEFLLAFDPEFTQQGEIITLNQSFVLDGQKLTLATVEIYPTHIRLNFEDDENNTAWLQALEFYLENEKGEKFESIGNGIRATGSVDSPMMASHRLESSFFSKSRSLTLHITGVTWLDKDMEQVEIDLANSTAEVLPEGVSLYSAERRGNSWILSFTAEEREENASYQIFSTSYYDEDGNEYAYNSWSSGMTGRYDEDKGEYQEFQTTFGVEFALKNYPYDVVYLSPIFSRIVSLGTPVVLEIK